MVPMKTFEPKCLCLRERLLSCRYLFAPSFSFVSGPPDVRASGRKRTQCDASGTLITRQFAGSSRMAGVRDPKHTTIHHTCQ